MKLFSEIKMDLNKKIKTAAFVSLGFLCVFHSAYSQPERSLVRKGNKQYQSGNFAESEITYRKALDKNRSSFNGSYNLGNALYRLEKYDEAAQQYAGSFSLAKEKEAAASDMHNLGNALLKAEKYEQSIEAYKNSLRINPNDNETRYNLAYAQAMLKQQQNQENKENKDKKDEQKQDEQKQEQKNEQQQQEQQKQQNSKPEQQKISKEDAERILQALKNNEQNLQKKLSKKESERIRIEKQW